MSSGFYCAGNNYRCRYMHYCKYVLHSVYAYIYVIDHSQLLFFVLSLNQWCGGGGGNGGGVGGGWWVGGGGGQRTSVKVYTN